MRTTSSALIVIVLSLLCLGIVVLASTSSVKGEFSHSDPGFFFKRQLVWMLIAAVAGLVLALCDYHWWQKTWVAIAMAVGSVALLVLVLVPHVGTKIGGSYRWLRLGPMSLQPSEIAKLGTVIALAAWMVRNSRDAQQFVKGLVLPGAGLAVVLGLLLREPDFGTTILVGTVGMAVLFAGGARFRYVALAGLAGAAVFAAAVVRDPVRVGRILAFLMPDKYPEKAYHLLQSKAAFISGGWLGVGLGNSIQKRFYLPEAHTDFILAIIGEELGLVGTGAVLLLFTGILICGLTISLKAPDPFGRLLGFGITMMIVLQAAINFGVVTGCLPTKGIPLPFISYGGSSLMASIAGVGLLLNIARHGGKGYTDEHTQVIRDRCHRF